MSILIEDDNIKNMPTKKPQDKKYLPKFTINMDNSPKDLIIKKIEKKSLFKVVTPPSSSSSSKFKKKLNNKIEIVDIKETNNFDTNNITISSQESYDSNDSNSAIEIKEIKETKELTEKDKKENLLNYFKGKKIYIEIYNGKENASSVFCEKLLEYQIIQCKRLCKNIDYIIFKEGQLKTKRYALMNKIKMVNPLWVDDKINRYEFKDDNEYMVENNMGDILLQEKLEKLEKVKNYDKNYENEIEAEYDVEYANIIDKEREIKNKSKTKEIKHREKRKINKNKTKNDVLFLSDEKSEKSEKSEKEDKNKNMLIDDFIEPNYNNNNIPNNINLVNSQNIFEIKNISDNEIIKENKDKDINENNLSNKKKNPFKIEKINKNSNLNITNTYNIYNINNSNHINTNNKDNTNNTGDNSNKIINNNNNQKPKSKTPDRTKAKSRKRIKKKELKHKATSKKIMVTSVQDHEELNKMPVEEEKTITSQIFGDSDINIINKKNKENENINSNFYKNTISKDNQDINNNNNKDEKNKHKKSTLGQKINIITYKLEEKEIQCLKTMNKFEYKGDLKNSTNTISDYLNIYSTASVIILDKEKSKYDWKMYEFFFDKKILVDFASFLFEFITETTNEDIIDAENTLDKLNKISINEENYFLNKKIRYQRRSLQHSLDIVKNISEYNTEKENKDENNNKNNFNFVINKDIMGGEKRIINKIIKFYLKANVIKIDFISKRSRSMAPGMIPGMKFKFLIENKNNINDNTNKSKNIFLIQKNYEKKKRIELNKENENEINENKNELDEDEESIDENSEYKNIEGDTYLITKEKIINTQGLNKFIPNFKHAISYKYVFDSFWAGELINLNDENKLKKYLMQ